MKQDLPADAASSYAQKAHVLVIDDDERIRTLVAKFLRKNDFVSMSAIDGYDGLNLIKRFSVDAVILDVMMPGMSGYEVAEHIRSEHPDLPVILLTALGETENRIEGFERGADDYLPKPFEPKELILRLKSLLRRSRVVAAAEQSARVGPYEFIKNDHILVNAASSEEIDLTELETKLIDALMSNPDQVVSREKLADLCEMQGSERAIDVQVTRLRRKIEEDPSRPRLLRTVRGKGYLLRP